MFSHILLSSSFSVMPLFPSRSMLLIHHPPQPLAVLSPVLRIYFLPPLFIMHNWDCSNCISHALPPFGFNSFHAVSTPFTPSCLSAHRRFATLTIIGRKYFKIFNHFFVAEGPDFFFRQPFLSLYDAPSFLLCFGVIFYIHGRVFGGKNPIFRW